MMPCRATRWGRALAFAGALVGASPGAGDERGAPGATMVRDIWARTQPMSSWPREFHRLGPWTVFLATTPAAGEELWRSDGSAAGTSLVTDLEPGPWSSEVQCMVERGDSVYFLARVPRVDDVSRELALWRSDGTAQGTVELARVAGDRRFQGPCAIAATSERVIFAAVHRQDDGFALDVWRSDGTAAGSERIARLVSAGRWDPHLFAVGDRVYFDALSDGAPALWKTDGSGGGTRLVKTLAAAGETAYPIPLAALGDQLLFAVYGREGTAALWRSNGTAGGTAPVVERTFPAELGTPNLVLGGRMLFSVAGEGIFATDATRAGTALAVAGVEAAAFARLGAAVLFLGRDPDGSALWRWDERAAAPARVVDLGQAAFGQEIAALDGQVLFTLASGPEKSLWRSDGTAAGTRLLTTLPTIDALSGAGGRAFFAAPGDDEASELWTSDGTAAGTHLLADIAADDQFTDSSFPADLVAVGDRLFFTAVDTAARGRQLWASDGTAAGTALVREIGEPYRANDIGDLTAFAGALFFATGRPSTGSPQALWRSDGTTAGTVVAQSRFAGAPYRLTVAGGALYFLLADYGWVCRTDGSDAGTGCGGGFRQVREMVAHGDRVVLSADPFMQGAEPWISDGTIEGTRLIKDIAPEPGRGSEPRLLATLGEQTYFVTTDDSRASVLWRSDGSEAGTQPVRSWPGTAEGVAVQRMVASGSQLFLSVDAADASTGLWVSDGTADGTRLLRRFDPAADGSAGILALAPFAGRVVMSAADGPHGAEPWISDGTADGTHLLRDLRPGPDSSSPQSFVDLGDRCAFVACTDLGCEPWITDGTSAGTTMVADVAPGVASSSPSGFAALHGTLYFAASDGVHGWELWREGAAPTCRGDCGGDGRVTIEELILAVGIALGSRPVGDCRAVDASGDGRVTIDELIAAVGAALAGC
ncbi:hypothetical protein KF840_18545 [bacterium]|nr:hypothetical protein [bacterium]